jgi:hypothetical protein
MKLLVAALLAAFAATVNALAQGTIFFSTRVPGIVDARVTYEFHSGSGPAGSDFHGQLLAGPPGGSLSPIGAPVEFRNDAGIGYITAGGIVTVPGVAGGSPAQVQMVAWHKSLGNDWQTAEEAGIGMIGRSAVITVITGGGGTPPAPPAFLGVQEGTPENTIQSFLVADVPEPALLTLASLGFTILLRTHRPERSKRVRSRIRNNGGEE